MASPAVSIAYKILNGYEKAQPILIPLAVLVCASTPGRRVFARLWRAIAWTARVPWRAIGVVALLSLALNAFLSLVVLMPQPRVHDEFSYLLAADTFAHGRLTNPPLPDPVWHHFETMHELQQPTYASKYPPGQGLMLAWGQVMTGRPIVGAWIVVALACGAICWMLSVWMPMRWAMCAALLAMVHTQTLEWGQSYWGGALALLGGSLLLGALLRILLRGPRIADGFVMGIGIAILANCRPSEGFFLTLLCGVLVTIWTITRRPAAWGIVLQRLAIPIGIIMLPVVAMMGYYNWRVTGSAVTTPYIVHHNTYAVVPPFVWQAAHWERTFRHKPISDLQIGWESPYWLRQQSPMGLLKEVGRKIRSCAGRYVFPIALVIPGLMIWPALRRDRTLRIVVTLLGALFVLVAFNQTWTQPHYLSLAFGLGCGVMIMGFRQLAVWQRNNGRAGSVIAHVVVLLLLGASLMWTVKRIPIGGGWPYARGKLIERLTHEGGQHLVVVRYAPDHRFLREWVFNSADIATAPVVFAREMSAGENLQLVDSFRDRKIWLFEPDVNSSKLVPYPAPALATTGAGEEIDPNKSAARVDPAVR